MDNHNSAKESGRDRDEVVIHIDKSEHRSPEQTTGAALYVLGKIDPEKYDLYQEVSGHGDDKLIPNDGGIIKLRNGDHFYSIQKILNPGA